MHNMRAERVEAIDRYYVPLAGLTALILAVATITGFIRGRSPLGEVNLGLTSFSVLVRGEVEKRLNYPLEAFSLGLVSIITLSSVLAAIFTRLLRSRWVYTFLFSYLAYVGSMFLARNAYNIGNALGSWDIFKPSLDLGGVRVYLEGPITVLDFTPLHITGHVLSAILMILSAYQWVIKEDMDMPDFLPAVPVLTGLVIIGLTVVSVGTTTVNVPNPRLATPIMIWNPSTYDVKIASPGGRAVISEAKAYITLGGRAYLVTSREGPATHLNLSVRGGLALLSSVERPPNATVYVYVLVEYPWGLKAVYTREIPLQAQEIPEGSVVLQVSAKRVGIGGVITIADYAGNNCGIVKYIVLREVYTGSYTVAYGFNKTCNISVHVSSLPVEIIVYYQGGNGELKHEGVTVYGGESTIILRP
ncbi:MAG: hypothetical protein F7C35_03610 [Desulfurococcales archaeon]|nr:hypothetical protein [Desulfurococcales archaeon]